MNSRLKDAMDRSLSCIDFDVRLMEGVMRRIKKTEGEAELMKRKMAVSLAMAVILVLVLAAGAFAAAYFSGTIDWSGNYALPTLEPRGFATPVPTESEGFADWHQVEEDLVLRKPEDEIWIAEYENVSGDKRGLLLGIDETVAELGDLKKRISEANLPFLLPDPPAGYMFKGASLRFFMNEQALKGVTFLSMDTPYAGVTQSRFRPGEDIQRNIESFVLQFEDTFGNQIIVNAWLASTETETGFGVAEGDVYEVASIPGMEKAIYIKRKGIDNTLYLMQTGIAPIAYVSPFAIDPDYKWGDDTQIFDAVTYDISSVSANRDIFLAIAGSLK